MVLEKVDFVNLVRRRLERGDLRGGVGLGGGDGAKDGGEEEGGGERWHGNERFLGVGSGKPKKVHDSKGLNEQQSVRSWRKGD